LSCAEERLLLAITSRWDVRPAALQSVHRCVLQSGVDLVVEITSVVCTTNEQTVFERKATIYHTLCHNLLSLD
jgi:hypothetical protein